MSCDREDQRRKTDEHKRICEHISVCNHRAPPLQEVDNLAVLTGRRIIAQSAALCQFAALRGGFFIFCALQLSHRYSVCLGDDHHLLPVAISPGIGPVRSGGGKGEKQCDSSDSLAEKSTGRNEISGTWNGQPRIEYGCPLDACGLFGGSCFLCS
jgi:hypothetical protein